MPTMLFYDRIVPLNRDRHRGLRLRTGQGRADFAAGTHYVPLAGTEFYQAARHFPVIFAGGEDGGPVALLGLREGQNLFIEDGRWVSGTYVPAFVRRYPFILAKGDRGDDYTVCFDQSYEGFSETEGTPLFDEAGKDSDYLAGVIRFLDGFRAEMERTQAFVDRLRELELLVQRNFQVKDGLGRRFLLRDFRVVDEAKLAKLEDAVLGELHRAGYLGWIYAHLISLGNITRFPAQIPVEQPTSAEAKEADASVEQTAASEADEERRETRVEG